MRRAVVVLATFNACAWPGVFAAYGLWSGNHARITFYTAAGGVFGGLVLLFTAVILFLFGSRFGTSRSQWKVQGPELSPQKIAVGGLIVLGIGTAGLIVEWLR
jgi:hypothetical protein